MQELFEGVADHPSAPCSLHTLLLGNATLSSASLFTPFFRFLRRQHPSTLSTLQLCLPPCATPLRELQCTLQDRPLASLELVRGDLHAMATPTTHTKDAAAAALASLLTEVCTSHLTLHRYNMRGVDLTGALAHRRNATHTTGLTLRECKLSARQFWQLLTGSQSSLAALHLSGMNTPPPIWRETPLALPLLLRALRTLTLQQPGSIDDLHPLLRHNRQLVSVRLSEHRCAQVHEFAVLLEGQLCLRVLCLDHCRLLDVGVGAVLCVLHAHLPACTHLSVRGNLLTERSAPLLHDALSARTLTASRSLVALDLSENPTLESSRLVQSVDALCGRVVRRRSSDRLVSDAVAEM
jgi:hypothetical protein